MPKVSVIPVIGGVMVAGVFTSNGASGVTSTHHRNITMTAWGTFKTGIVFLEHSPDGGVTWIRIKKTDIKKNGQAVIEGNYNPIRLSMRSANAGVSVQATIAFAG